MFTIRPNNNNIVGPIVQLFEDLFDLQYTFTIVSSETYCKCQRITSYKFYAFNFRKQTRGLDRKAETKNGAPVVLGK